MGISKLSVANFFNILNSAQQKKTNVPFSLYISSYRRKKIMDALMTEDPIKQREGEKIINV